MVTADFHAFRLLTGATAIKTLKVNGVTLTVFLPRSREDGQHPDETARPSSLLGQFLGGIKGTDLDFGSLPGGLSVSSASISNAALDVYDHRGTPLASLGDINLNVEQTGTGYYRLSITVGKGWVSDGPGGSRHSLEVARTTLLLQRRGVSIEEMVLGALGARATVRGKVQDLRRAEANLHLDATVPLSALAAVRPGLPPMQGTVGIRLQTDGSAADPVITGRVALDKGQVELSPGEPMSLDRLEAPFSLRGFNLRVADAVAHMGPRGKLHIEEFQVLLRDRFPITSLKVRFEDMELAELLEDCSVAGSFVMLTVNGPVRMTGSFNPFLMDGEADLSCSHFRLQDQSFRKYRPGQSLIMDIPEGRVRTHVHIDDERVRLTRGTVQRNASVIRVVRNDFNFDTAKGFYFEYASDQMDLRDAGPIVGLNLRGQGSLHAVLTAPYDEPLIRGEVKMRTFGIEGFDVGDLSAAVHHDRGVLSFPNGMATNVGGSVQFNLRFDFTQKAPRLAADWYSEGFLLAGLWKGLNLRNKPPVNGKMVGAGEVHGPFDHLEASTDSTVTDLDISGFVIPSLRLTASMDPEGLVDVPLLAARFSQGEVTAQGQVGSGGSMAFKARSKGIDLKAIPFFEEALPGLSGPADLEAMVSGVTSRPVASAVLTGSDIRYRGVALGPARVSVGLEGDKLTFEGGMAGDRVSIAGSLDLPSQRLSLSPRVTGFDFASLLNAVTDSDISAGSVDLEGELSGHLGKLAELSGNLTLKHLSVGKNAITLGLDKPGTVAVTRGQFHLPGLRFSGEHGFALVVGGSFGFTGLADLVINGDIPLDQLPRLLGQQWQSTGTATVRSSLTGTGVKGYLLDGMVTVRDASLLLAPSAPVMDNIEASLLLTGRSLTLDRFKASVGDGALSGSGLITLEEDLGLKNFSITATVNKVTYPLATDIKPILSGELTLSGDARQPPRLKGDLNVLSLLYTQRVPWEMQLFENIKTIFERQQKGTVTREETPAVAFDIAIRGDKTIQLNNNIGQADFTSDLRLTGDNENPGLMGTLSADQGFLIFQAKNLEIQNFLVRFNDPSRIFAEFDVSLASEAIDYTCGDREGSTVISVTITGNQEDYQLQYTSDAPDLIDSTQIWSVLLSNSCGMSQENFETEMKNLVGGIVTTPFEQQFGMETRIVFEPVQTSSTTTKVVPRFTVGKSLTPNITVIYSTTIAEEEGDDRRVKLKYRKKNFSLQGEWSSGNTLQQGGFGVDLLYHVDLDF